MKVKECGLRYFIGKRIDSDKIQHISVPGQQTYFTDEKLAEIALEVYNRMNDKKAEIFEVQEMHAKPRYVPSIRDAF